MNYGKVEISPNRLQWNPAPLAEQVVIVTTVDASGEPHLATKSRVAVISYGPPTVLALGCQAKLRTAQNAQATHCFVINVPGDDLVATSWVIGCAPEAGGPQLFVDNGLTPIPSLKVSAPRIGECRAHLECELLETRQFGDDLALFGKVVNVTVDELLTQGSEELRYRRLSPFFFLDFSWTAAMSSARRVEEPVPGPRHELTILSTTDLLRAADFYGRAFDWPVRIKNRTYVEFAIPGGRGLALCRRDAVARYVGRAPLDARDGELTGVQIYLRSEDLARTIARLVAAGARELSEFSARDWGEEAAYFADPDGNIIVVARRLPPETAEL